MNASLDHVSINVSNAQVSFQFYRKFLGFLGYYIVKESVDSVGFRKDGSDIWVNETHPDHKKEGFHRKRTGLNHLAVKVDTREAVDQFHKDFLQAQGIPTLYNTPKPFPEYTPNYYAVFFEDPDRIKLEVLFR